MAAKNWSSNRKIRVSFSWPDLSLRAKKGPTKSGETVPLLKVVKPHCKCTIIKECALWRRFGISWHHLLLCETDEERCSSEWWNDYYLSDIMEMEVKHYMQSKYSEKWFIFHVKMKSKVFFDICKNSNTGEKNMRIVISKYCITISHFLLFF